MGTSQSWGEGGQGGGKILKYVQYYVRNHYEKEFRKGGKDVVKVRNKVYTRRYL